MNEYKMNLLAKVAHDVRNPINSMNYQISETIDMLFERILNMEAIKNNLSTMKSNIFFVLFLVNDIMDYILHQ